MKFLYFGRVSHNQNLIVFSWVQLARNLAQISRVDPTEIWPSQIWPKLSRIFPSQRWSKFGQIQSSLSRPKFA